MKTSQGVDVLKPSEVAALTTVDITTLTVETAGLVTKETAIKLLADLTEEQISIVSNEVLSALDIVASVTTGIDESKPVDEVREEANGEEVKAQAIADATAALGIPVKVDTTVATNALQPEAFTQSAEVAKVADLVKTESVVADPKPTPEVKEATAMDSASLMGKITYQNIVDYCDAMSPRKPITQDAGARLQVTLFRSITQAINSLEADFNVVFGSILALVHEHSDGAFHESKVFRFMDNIPLTQSERMSFQRLLNLLKLTADPKGRSVALKQLNLELSLEFISEAGKQKVNRFFHK